MVEAAWECSPVRGADWPGKWPGSAAVLGTEMWIRSDTGASALLFLSPSRRHGGPPVRWRHPVEAQHPAGGLGTPHHADCYQPKVQKPAYVMVCRSISAHGMIDLHICDGTIDAEAYVGILERHMLLSR